MASLVDTILSQHDRMQFYRSGDIANWGWGRQEYWRQIPKPRPGPWPGVQPDSGDDLRDTEGPEFRPHGGGSRDDDDDDQGDDDDDEDANEERDTAISAIRHVAQDLHREHGGRLRFNRILGYGGFGVVGLFDVLDQWGNRVEQVVIKARKEGSNSAMFLAEIRWHQVSRLLRCW